MPFARVGIFPTPSRKDGPKKGTKVQPSRKKGITMETLKKQTALRLAKEQQSQIQPIHAAAAANPRVVKKNRSDHIQTSSSRLCNNSGVSAIRSDSNFQHYHNPCSKQIGSNVRDTAVTGSYYDQSSVNTNVSRKASTRRVHSPPNVMGISNVAIMPHSIFQQHDQLNWYHPSPTENIPIQAQQPPAVQCFESPSIKGMNSTASNKFPHGLTVHELKEMTKARLHAEATERHETDKRRHKKFENQSRPPLDVQTVVNDSRGSFMSSDHNRSHILRHQADAPDSRGPVPSLVQVHTLSADQNQTNRYPPQVSPIPGMQNYNNTLNSANSTFLENNGQENNRQPFSRNQQEFRVDNWDTTSIGNNSVASDYLGSENALSGYDDGSGAHFGRPRSYTGNSAYTAASDMTFYENTTSALSSPGGSFFEAAVGTVPNRKRAATLSPRPGLTLLHEDRPFSSELELGMHSFQSRTRRPLSIPPENTFSSPSRPLSSEIPGIIGHPLTGIFGEGANDFFNRARTSSTTSLPAISHTAEEFALEHNAASQTAMDRNQGWSASIQDEIPNSATASFLGSSSLYSGNCNDLRIADSNKVSSVFRNSSDLGLRASDPCNILGVMDDSSSQLDANFSPLPSRVRSMDSFSGSRARTSTWNGSSTNDFFSSSSLIDNSRNVEALVGDLASILKLSGAEERSEDFDITSGRRDPNPRYY